MSVYGVEELKKIVTVASKIGNIAGKAFEDGKINASDLVLVTDLLQVFPLLLALNFGQVMPEAKDLQQSEVEELIAHFKAEFDLPQDSLEVTIETVLDIAITVEQAIVKLIKIFKK